MKGTAVLDMGIGTGDVREQERSRLGLEFGLESTTPYDRHPQRFIPTAGSSAAVVVNSTSDAGAGAAANAHLPPLYPTSGANNGGTREPIFYHNGGGRIYDSYDAAARAWQPFPTSFKSQAETAGMGSPVTPPCSPFTPAQWQELNRQALIYKHFVSSAPVPPDLLFDARALPSIPPVYQNPRGGGAGYFNLRFANSTDPEPGRCRRTDGKKWRCSREVAPDHKYCERHMHRGRPRSRKPVEQRQKSGAAAASATSNLVGGTCTTTTTTSSAASSSAPINTEVMGDVPPKPYGRTPAPVMLPFLSPMVGKEPRYCLDWMKGGLEEIHSRGKNSVVGPVTLHKYEGGEFKLNHSDLNDPCNSFLNADLASLDPDQRYPPRSFIDAWSNEKPPVSSALTLSMSGGGMNDGDQIQMGLGMNESAGRSQEDSVPPLSWMNPVTTLGGPLAEALGSHKCNGGGEGRMSGGRSYAGPMDHQTGRSCCRSDGVVSPRDSPLRIGTSPTGVLQRTFVSLSDSSSNSSPTFGTGGGRSEMGHLQWSGQPA